MGADSKIEWTHHTFNPWWGCEHVHAGCTHCYAETFAKRTGRAQWGKHGTRVMTSAKNWAEPIKWNRQAEKAGERRRVFCASMADVFEDWRGPVLAFNGEQAIYGFAGDLCTLKSPGPIPKGMEPYSLTHARSRLFQMIDATPWLDWLLLTKRPENVRRMWPMNYACPADQAIWRRPNVWIGTSVSDQATADAAIPELLKLRDLTPVLFLSAEPLLGPVKLVDAAAEFGDGSLADLTDATPGWDFPGVDWVIVGGESGAKSRPCLVEWVRSIVEKCDAAGVPCFVKQLGGNATDGTMRPQSIRDPKGGDPAEWPEDLRVREFPERENARC